MLCASSSLSRRRVSERKNFILRIARRMVHHRILRHIIRVQATQQLTIEAD